MKVALEVAYQGTRYHGWQRQEEGVQTVQGTLEAAVATIANHPVEVSCAGRTDAGVHAFGQVVHFDTHSERRMDAWVMGTNAQLPDDISVVRAATVAAEFDARHSALARRYVYLIDNHRVRHALLRPNLARFPWALDEGAMNIAAQALIGEQDFTSFRAANCQSLTPMRNVHAVSVTRQGDLVIVDITASAFLYHMVRNIVGSLLEVGRARQGTQWIAELLAAKNRSIAGDTAEAAGLYLASVTYPEGLGWDNRVSLRHFFGTLGLPN